jgi:alpha-ketoglutarate-dependent taurine dioxygenase
MTVRFRVTAFGQSCGASIEGLDLSQPLDDATIKGIRATGGYQGYERVLHRTVVG